MGAIVHLIDNVSDRLGTAGVQFEDRRQNQLTLVGHCVLHLGRIFEKVEYDSIRGDT